MRNEEGGNSVTTVLLRGSTDSILDDLERAVDDGVNTYKVSFCTLFCSSNKCESECRMLIYLLCCLLPGDVQG